MSTHPNAILVCALMPDGTTRKTLRAILEEKKAVEHQDADDITIGEHVYHTTVMESGYSDSWQLSAKEGEILFHDFLTYGYGGICEWEKLVAQQKALEEWAKIVCEKYKCTYRIFVTANYW